MSGALADAVGRVGALLAGAHVGRGSCCALPVDCAGLAGPQWCKEDQMKSGQDERRAVVLARSVDVLDQKVGNKIDLILA